MQPPPPASVSSLSLRETVTSRGYSLLSFSTFDGLGSSTGKAIFTVGKLTLKGIEQLIISRRLASISAQFPHLDIDNIPKLHSMYMDLLEFSRIDMYSHSTRTRAIQILMRQIARRRTTSLAVALSTWSVVEVKLLISEIISWFDPTRKMEYERAILSDYRDHLSKWEEHSLAPVIDFLRDLASYTELGGWSTVLSCGCLDLFLQLYVADYQDPLYIDTPHSKESRSFAKSSISATCNSFLMEALADENSRGMITSHPICGLWPRWPMLAFGHMAQNRHHQRREMWKRVGEKQIRWRISSIYDTSLMEWPLHRGIRQTLIVDPWLPDLMIDLLEFSGSSELPEEVCFRALRSMHKLWARLTSLEVRSGLRSYTEETPDDHARRVFSQLINRLIKLSDRTSESESFFEPCRQNCLEVSCLLGGSCPLELDGAIHFIHHLSRVSDTNEDLRRLLVDGGIFGLLDTSIRRLSSLRALDIDISSDLLERQEPPAHPGAMSRGPRSGALALTMMSALLHERGGDKWLKMTISNLQKELSLLRIPSQQLLGWESEPPFFHL
ncbi:hypothetical protein D9757_006445 [Collybiopsis confluens]|uniref:Uncharacterized protein n=1 Tax=Collybiopsis confluens TaxID=2823264 RepID=A0A8H5HJK4_9AGAR|nr:hypothetical protein D9757_006445 [Collybiopsis confluens]